MVIHNAMKITWKTFLNILFPQKCIGCGITQINFCTACMSSLPRARPPEDRFIHALYDYRHPLVKHVIWKLKYKNAKDVAECFADSLLEEIIAVLNEELLVFESEKPLIVPIPLHKKRLRERGYNQSDLIAKAVVARGGQKIFDVSTTLLRRIKETKSQVRSEKRTVRIKNLEDAFICDAPSIVRGRTIILIDDVTTTGATLSSAKKALIRANPKKILAFTIAH